MAIDFYSKSGEPVAYTEDGQHIYLFSGRPVAFLSGNAVYSFSGKHIQVNTSDGSRMAG